jgi:predicted transcriptional regulator
MTGAPLGDVLTVRLTPAEHKALAAAAADADRSRSWIVRRALARYLADLEAVTDAAAAGAPHP